MSDILRKLPPLSTLRPFEASARYENFTEAAAELCVTPAAVSKQIRVLEEYLGVPVFTRNGRNLTLTAAGRDLYHMISKGLTQIANGASQLRRDKRENRIAIAMRTSFANHFLSRRLVDLFSNFPDIEFKFQTTERNPALLMNSVDLAIALGHEPQPHVVADHLITEVIAPVCSPQFLEARPSLSSISDLPDQTLLHLGNDAWQTLNWEPADWPAYFSHFGIPHDTSPAGPVFNNYEMLINAASSGLGVAIAWHCLVDNFIKDGRLTYPVEKTYSIGRCYYLLCRKEQANHEVFARLRDWFLDQTAPYR